MSVLWTAEQWEARLAEVKAERDQAREECGHEKAMRASLREELHGWIERAQKREAERDVLAERLARVEALADRWQYDEMPDPATADRDLRAALAGESGV